MMKGEDFQVSRPSQKSKPNINRQSKDIRDFEFKLTSAKLSTLDTPSRTEQHSRSTILELHNHSSLKRATLILDLVNNRPQPDFMRTRPRQEPDL